MTTIYLLSAAALIGSLHVYATFVNCPGSPAETRASCEMRYTFSDTDCDEKYDNFRDTVERFMDGCPNDGGTYDFRDENDDNDKTILQASRLTPDELFIDLIDYTFEQDGADCNVGGCSESQVTSVFDFSTNYCNIWNVFNAGGAVYDDTIKNCTAGAGTDVNECEK